MKKNWFLVPVITFLFSNVPSSSRCQTPTPTPVFCYSNQWGTAGPGNGQFNQPNGAAVYGMNLYISDYSNNRVEKYDLNLNWIADWGVGLISAPGQVAFDKAGNLYVTNQGTNNVMVFNSSGTTILTFGSSGTGNGQFSNPIGLAVDSNGTIYVCDFSSRLQKFTSSGVYVGQWGGLGSANGQFNGPAAIAIDGSNNLYVADTNNQRIEKFDSNGNYITQFGSNGTGLGQFRGPWGIQIGPCGDVYATDRVANFIQVFSPTGTALSQYGTSGSGNGPFNGVMGVAFDGSNNLYTTEYLNNRLQKFTLCGMNCPLPPTATPTVSGPPQPNPGDFYLYPAPARGDHATVAYVMTGPGRVDLKVWNEKAELVAHVMDSKTGGLQTTPFSIAGFATGVYFYSLTLSYDSGGSQKLGPKKFAVIH